MSDLLATANGGKNERLLDHLGAEVTDSYAQQEYGQLWKPIAEKYGAKLKLLDGVHKEANASKRALAVGFESYEQAKACYEDPAYTKTKVFALRASKRELIITEGLLV